MTSVEKNNWGRFPGTQQTSASAAFHLLRLTIGTFTEVQGSQQRAGLVLVLPSPYTYIQVRV